MLSIVLYILPLLIQLQWGNKFLQERKYTAYNIMVAGMVLLLFLLVFPAIQLFDYCMFLSQGKETDNHCGVGLAKTIIVFSNFVFLALLIALTVFQSVTVKTKNTSR